MVRIKKHQPRQRQPRKRLWWLSGGALLLAVIYGVNLIMVTVRHALSDFVMYDLDPVRHAWKLNLLERIARIKQVCGTLCDLNNETAYRKHLVTVPGANFDMISVPDVNCSGIIMNTDIDASDYTYPWPPPRELRPYFTLAGLIQDRKKVHYMDGYLGKENTVANNWTTGHINFEQSLVRRGRLDKLRSSYGAVGTRRFYEKLQELNLTNKHVLVIGSERPWIECICLHLGASHVTTLEYGTIETDHPQLTTMTPDDFRNAFTKGTLGPFDTVMSHSSLEHSGLGRYGDALNPWGDIIALARAWCVTRSGGELYLGLPTGKDYALHNMNRMYGRIRWPLVTANWKQIDGHTHNQSELDYDNEKQVRRLYGGTGFLFEKVD